MHWHVNARTKKMKQTKIIAPYYSGEFTMGRVSEAFVEYWSDKEEADLLEYLHEVNWSEDFESPSPTETGSQHRTPFHEIDDLEHLNMPYTDSEFVHVAEDGEEIEFKPFNCHTRYISHIAEEDFNNNFIPVLIYATTEKGMCGHWTVELENEEFDKTKFVISTVETAFGRFVDAAWYGTSDEELEFDTGDASTMTKATSAKVGWAHKNTLEKSKTHVLNTVLKAKNNHVNIEKESSIQGLDLSKYI